MAVRRKIIIKLVLGFSLLLMPYITLTIYKPATQNTFQEKRRKIVLIVAYYRSGSTFFGHLFNKNPKAFYLFEPLWPYGFQCDKLRNERIEFLKNISTCNFQHVPATHRKVQEITHYSEKYSRCIPTNICFSQISPQAVIKHYRSVCELDNIDLNNATFSELLNASRQQRKNNFPLKESAPLSAAERNEVKCGSPYNTRLESALCHSSSITAFKSIRVCNISQIEQLYKELVLAGEDVYVIHLIRDVRATLSSAFKLELERKNITNEAKQLCDRYRDKITFFQKHIKSDLLADNKLLEIRNEDLTMNAMANAKLVYRFIGEELHPDVRRWIWENNIATKEVLKSYYAQMEKTHTLKEVEKLQLVINGHLKQMRSSYGTARVPSEVVNKWRETLTMEEIKIIQKECGDVLQYYKYKMIQSNLELHDTSIRTW